MKQPIMRIEHRLFDRGWVRSATATRKCGNIYFRKYFMAVRSSQILVSRNIFVPLLKLMVGSRSIHYSSFASHNKSYGPTGSGINLTLQFQQYKYTVQRWASPLYYTVDPMLLPSRNPFKCHREVLYLQPMIPPKRFDLFPA